ncbi:hypothetical protein [Ruminiclostridium cellobioparum]|uniref:hypothetical protein n=1 Tax=Ruminiclostridium cellobioparum TaxID=29355 RepID=UPI0012B62177|nr:hypothetical protein [Ruminiclostridium cellobioparum]
MGNTFSFLGKGVFGDETLLLGMLLGTFLFLGKGRMKECSKIKGSGDLASSQKGMDLGNLFSLLGIMYGPCNDC